MDSVETQETVCEKCAIEIMTRSTRGLVPFTKHSQQLLHRVFTNVVGPFPRLSLGALKYFSTLIYEYRGYLLVSFIYSKDRDAEAVKHMMLTKENTTNKRPSSFTFLAETK